MGASDVTLMQFDSLPSEDLIQQDLGDSSVLDLKTHAVAQQSLQDQDMSKALPTGKKMAWGPICDDLTDHSLAVDARSSTLEEKSAQARRAFKADRLLIRAMTLHVNDKIHNFSYASDWDLELDLMCSPQRLSNTSCTLLVADHKVRSYHEYGFMFDASAPDVEIIDIDSEDCGSGVNASGQFTRGRSDTQHPNLDSLAHFVRTHEQRPDMNEVNAHFRIHHLTGLYVTKTHEEPIQAQKLLSLLTIRRHIKAKYNVDLPVFFYDQASGQLEEINLSEIQSQLKIAFVRYKRAPSYNPALAQRMNDILEVHLPERFFRR